MAAHVRARATRQIHGRALEVLGAAPSPRGDARADARQALRVGQQRRVHLRLDVPRGDGVNGDALARPLVGEALGELADGALGGGVGGHGEAALEGEQRGEVDDAAAAAGDGGGVEVKHVGADVAAEREDGVEVDLHDLGGDCVSVCGSSWEVPGTHLVEVIVGEFLAGMTTLNAGAVDEDAHFVAVGENLGRQGRDLFLDCHVGCVNPGLAAQGLDKVFCLCDTRIALPIVSTLPQQISEVSSYLDEDNIRARFCQTYGDGLANASGAASDHGRVALKRKHGSHCLVSKK